MKCSRRNHPAATLPPPLRSVIACRRFNQQKGFAMTIEGERRGKLQLFVWKNLQAFADRADAGFRDQGPGCVVLNVHSLAGGDQFKPQSSLDLGYASKPEIRGFGSHYQDVLDAVARSIYPTQTVIVAEFPGGGHVFTRIDLAAAARHKSELDSQSTDAGHVQD
jgi:hypothetical protein